MNRQQIVVTGGYGFIGSRFVKYVVENTDFNVVIIDKNTYAADKKRVTSWLDPQKHVGRVRHYVSDVADEDLCSQTDHILKEADYVVNFAAETHVDNSIADGNPFIRTNVLGVFNLLEILRGNKALKRFVQISTDEVYGDMDEVRGGNLGADEGFKLRGSSYYSASKASADLLVEACSRTYGLPYLITRTCNNFGPNQHPEKFLPKLMKSIDEGTEVPVYGDGQQVREWIHVDDNVKFLFHLMIHAPQDQVFNIGSGETHKNIDIVKMVAEFMIGKEVKYKFVKDRLGHDRRYFLNCQKLTSFMERRPMLSTLEYFLKGEVIEHLKG